MRIDGLKLEGDEKVGANIVTAGARGAHPKIVENAGLEGSVIVERVKAETLANRGYDADGPGATSTCSGGGHRPDEGRAGRPAERRLHRLPAC